MEDVGVAERPSTKLIAVAETLGKSKPVISLDTVYVVVFPTVIPEIVLLTIFP